MRAENNPKNVVSNGYNGGSASSTPGKQNAGTISGRLSFSNGGSTTHLNGGARIQQRHRDPLYRGHNREEVTRILIQGLIDMGYASAASTLCNESGYELESIAVAAFRSAILEGNWLEAERLLLGRNANNTSLANGKFSIEDGLVLAEGADKDQMLFWIRQQKFLELLDRRDLGQALMVLRQELAPLHHDVHQLHVLSSLLMCPPEDLRSQANWPESVAESRRSLLQDLTGCIAPSVMIRDHRLAELLNQVKEAQINRCSYHNTSAPPSLYADHTCNRADFPARTWVQLDDHTDEVWHVRFSHDGSKLATASQDKTVIIYETTNFKQLFKLEQHEKEVTFIAWSPDDEKLITCSKDHKARVWDISNGRLLMESTHEMSDTGSHALTSAAWAPDSLSFVTSSTAARAPLCLWKLFTPDSRKAVHTWTGNGSGTPVRVVECCITPDGRRLVAVDMKYSLHVYDLHTYREEYCHQFSAQPTSLTISQDRKTLLVNLSNREIHLFDLDERCTTRVFKGHAQGNFVIRSCFGGAAENFILSGSEDGKVYIWHKGNEALIEVLAGHGQGPKNSCVTTVAWNPKDSGMFASGGDDRKVTIWTNNTSTNESIIAANEGHGRLESSRAGNLRSTHPRGESNL